MITILTFALVVVALYAVVITRLLARLVTTSSVYTKQLESKVKDKEALIDLAQTTINRSANLVSYFMKKHKVNNVYLNDKHYVVIKIPVGQYDKQIAEELKSVVQQTFADVPRERILLVSDDKELNLYELVTPLT